MMLVRTYATQPPLARGLEEVAFVAGMSGAPDRVARLLGAVAALRERIGLPMIAAYQHFYDQLVEGVWAALGDDELQRAWNLGSTLSLEQAVACALETVGSGA